MHGNKYTVKLIIIQFLTDCCVSKNCWSLLADSNMRISVKFIMSPMVAESWACLCIFCAGPSSDGIMDNACLSTIITSTKIDFSTSIKLKELQL